MIIEKKRNKNLDDGTNIFKHRFHSGFSLIEILVVISIFAVIGILTTRSIFITLRSARKSDSLVRVRENVNYAMGIIERQIRTAESVNCANVHLQIYLTLLTGEFQPRLVVL